MSTKIHVNEVGRNEALYTTLVVVRDEVRLFQSSATAEVNRLGQKVWEGRGPFLYEWFRGVPKEMLGKVRRIGKRHGVWQAMDFARKHLATLRTEVVNW